MNNPSSWEEAIDEILLMLLLDWQRDQSIPLKKAKQIINQAVKDHIIADILGMCLETQRPGEFPSVDALMIRDKIVLKYLVTKGNE